MAKPSIFLDPVNPRDFLAFKIPFACEDCSHFDHDDAKFPNQCTMGYNAQNHRRELQLKRYELSGRMAQCRFLEID